MCWKRYIGVKPLRANKIVGLWPVQLPDPPLFCSSRAKQGSNGGSGGTKEEGHGLSIS